MSLIQGGGMILILLSVICSLLGCLVYAQTKRVDAQERASQLERKLAEQQAETVQARRENLVIVGERDFYQSELMDLIVGFEMVTDPRPSG